MNGSNETVDGCLARHDMRRTTGHLSRRYKNKFPAGKNGHGLEGRRAEMFGVTSKHVYSHA
jgi:hypothetical protein